METLDHPDLCVRVHFNLPPRGRKIHLVLARIKLLAALKNFKRGEEGACDCVCDNYANCNFFYFSSVWSRQASLLERCSQNCWQNRLLKVKAPKNQRFICQVVNFLWLYKLSFFVPRTSFFAPDCASFSRQHSLEMLFLFYFADSKQF